jgi:hypothetical protein
MAAHSIPNPNGIASQSPRLRGTSYLGSAVFRFNLNEVAAHPFLLTFLLFSLKFRLKKFALIGAPRFAK